MVTDRLINTAITKPNFNKLVPGLLNLSYQTKVVSI